MKVKYIDIKDIYYNSGLYYYVNNKNGYNYYIHNGYLYCKCNVGLVNIISLN